MYLLRTRLCLCNSVIISLLVDQALQGAPVIALMIFPPVPIVCPRLWHMCSCPRARAPIPAGTAFLVIVVKHLALDGMHQLWLAASSGGRARAVRVAAAAQVQDAPLGAAGGGRPVRGRFRHVRAAAGGSGSQRVERVAHVHFVFVSDVPHQRGMR